MSTIIDRSGRTVPLHYDEITRRIEGLCSADCGGRPLKIVAPELTRQVILRFTEGMTTRDLDMETAKICAARAGTSRDYSDLAARILVSDLQKNTPPKFSLAVKLLAERGRVSAQLEAIVERFGDAIDAEIVDARDYNFDHFGIETMKHTYLMRDPASDQIVERPQYAYMRVALGIHGAASDRTDVACCLQPRLSPIPDQTDAASKKRLDEAFRCYHLLSQQEITHATPTMINAGTAHPQLSSCFLLGVDDDLQTLYRVVGDAGLVSKYAGGVGINLTPMRAAGSLIRSSGGQSSGVSPYVLLCEASRSYANQAGRRLGAYALYLEPWHADVFEFLKMGRIKGPLAAQHRNAPQMKYALWVPDLFMRTLRDECRGGDGAWHLFCPDQAPELARTWGREFETHYWRYVEEKRFRRVVRASEIARAWFKTVTQQGNPYVGFKDNVNRASNLCGVCDTLGRPRHIGCSNLCIEVTIPSWHDAESDQRSDGRPLPAAAAEYGVCNLAAVNLAKAHRAEGGRSSPREGNWVDYQKIVDLARAATVNLDRTIDANFYPPVSGDACRRSNQRHRPVGLGVMGLADLLVQQGLVFGSPEARRVDMACHAALYYGAALASVTLAEQQGAHPSAASTPAAQGLLQPDLYWRSQPGPTPDWESEVEEATGGTITAAMWQDLRRRLRAAGGFRNGYLTALMPTATSSNAAQVNECFEWFTSMIFTRRTLAGEFMVVNRYLQQALEARGLWTDRMRQTIMQSNGSVAGISEIPADLRRLFRTAREMDQRCITAHAVARVPFVSQGMSLNYYFGRPLLREALTVLMMGWEHGLPTGSYYMHSQPSAGTFSHHEAASVRSKTNADAASDGPTCEIGCTSCAL